jgi:hypothetical protein
VTALFRRLNQFPYTSYLTTACTTLETAREYESDRFLTAQVGLQRLVLKAYNAFPNPESDASAPAEFNPGLYMTMVSIRNEMESLKKNAPVVITSHCKSVFDAWGAKMTHGMQCGQTNSMNP